MLKNKVRYKNDKVNGGRPSEITSEMLDMIKVNKSVMPRV